MQFTPSLSRFLGIGIEGKVVRSPPPLVSTVASTFWGTTLFSLIQAALQIGAIEPQVRKGEFGSISPTADADQH